MQDMLALKDLCQWVGGTFCIDRAVPCLLQLFCRFAELGLSLITFFYLYYLLYTLRAAYIFSLLFLSDFLYFTYQPHSSTPALAPAYM